MFAEAGEYGLAIETLCDILSENQTPVPSSLLCAASECLVAMNVDSARLRRLLPEGA